MSKFICRNQRCSQYGKESEYRDNRYKFIDGKFVSENAPCPKCGEIREEINENTNVPLSEKNVEIGKYSSASAEGKREILKQRSHEDFLKNIKPVKDYKLNELTKKV